MTLKVLLLGVFLAPKVDKWPRKSKFLVSKPFLERNQMERRLSIGPPSVLLSQSLRGINAMVGEWKRERKDYYPELKFGFVSHNFLRTTILSEYYFKIQQAHQQHGRWLTKFKPLDILLDFVSAQLTAQNSQLFYTPPPSLLAAGWSLLTSEGDWVIASFNPKNWYTKNRTE